MKVIDFNISGNEELAVGILRHIEWLVCEHKDAVAGGWRCLIEMQHYNEGEPYLLLDVQSNKGGGDYAEAKMDMLLTNPDLAATGLETPAKFAERLEQRILVIPKDQEKADEYRRNLDRIRKLEYIEQMPKDIAEYLRDYSMTSYKGAIKVPYDGLLVAVTTNHVASLEPKAGEIRIAFSGAEEWQDLYFATSILSYIQRTLASDYVHLQIRYGLSGLQADPQTNMWLKLLGIKEAPEL